MNTVFLFIIFLKIVVISKSEDILYEIKKIQQKAILEHGLTYDYMQDGLSLEKAQSILDHKKEQRIENIIFSQEKYSNGETSLQFFKNTLYLKRFIY